MCAEKMNGILSSTFSLCLLFANPHNFCLGTPLGVSVILGDTAFHLDAFYPTVKSLVGLLWWLSSKEFTCQTEDAGSIPGLGRFPGKENDNLLHYSCLEILWTEEPCQLQSTGL